jgi:hypothetical protein
MTMRVKGIVEGAFVEIDHLLENSVSDPCLLSFRFIILLARLLHMAPNIDRLLADVN